MAERLPNFKEYQCGGLAAYLARSEESGQYASGALEKLADDLHLGEKALGFIRGTQASEEGLKVAIGEYAAKFEEKRQEYKLGDLASWYDPALRGLDDESKNKILATLTKHDITLKELREKVTDANTIKKGSSRLFNPGQKAQADETLKMYTPVLKVLETLDKYTFESLRPDAVDSTRKQEIKDLASKL